MSKLESGEELSRVLIKSAPDNLREIRLVEMVSHRYGITFSLETLDAFLDNWRENLNVVKPWEVLFGGDV
ncbi:6644_t:CDS:2 [Funneliformis mosseae]|uniref:6644_t:CDS:1 n=1 Tax=Funneliformis mosseae TaxID=27381 RepID=A0A9N8VR06_FUNMO|nr:6644_t:CDS:2 [Funneliformis mosseae]